ncbi:hypothetical protein PROFUN_07879 [Planoprotostelium fungivorum]|uniref:beta-N-acetylhexosaminidase n=1 Tax=Planoprotostelium fungivorum TaxID=1890364 RepID=A0A2P6NL06_9EUKA|nr:hypothetical protein PROFUN_07879 [Planoprotostelium fungivorum]
MRSSLIFAVFLFASATAFSFVPIWPQPSHLTAGNATVLLSATFTITNFHGGAISSSCLLGRAAARYTGSIRATTWTPEYANTRPTFPQSGTITGLSVSVTSTSEVLTPGVDESYTLQVPAGGVATLNATTVFGAIRGFETFSQLVRQRLSDNRLEVAFTPVLIRDSPTFIHRGILLDTSRHFFPVGDLLRTLDGMSTVKLNVLHWHITDSQSFPLLSKAVPELAQKGAYKKRGVIQVYNQTDVDTIVRYGYERGIRVIPEIDMPGHTRSWAFSHPELTTCVGTNFEINAAEPPAGQLDPTLDATYNLIYNLLDDVAPWYTDSFWHAGGDEVNFNCWNTSSNVRQYLKTHHATFTDLVKVFTGKVYERLQKLGKTIMLWEEMVLNFGVVPPKNSIVQAWQGPASTKASTAAGYQTVVSDFNAWYLDCGHGDFPGDGPSYCDPFKTWMNVYSYDPLFNLTSSESKLVIGGEVSLWTEQTSPNNLDRMLWPRAAAGAEVMWSGKENGQVRNWVPATGRLWEVNERLILKGIAAEPLQPTYCATNMCYFSETSVTWVVELFVGLRVAYTCQNALLSMALAGPALQDRSCVDRHITCPSMVDVTIGLSVTTEFSIAAKLNSNMKVLFVAAALFAVALCAEISEDFSSQVVATFVNSGPGPVSKRWSGLLSNDATASRRRFEGKFAYGRLFQHKENATFITLFDATSCSVQDPIENLLSSPFAWVSQPDVKFTKDGCIQDTSNLPIGDLYTQRIGGALRGSTKTLCAKGSNPLWVKTSAFRNHFTVQFANFTVGRPAEPLFQLPASCAI